MDTKHLPKEEYEILTYPKLQHIHGNIVHVINRNTHVHRALELGLVLDGVGIVRLEEKDFTIQKGSLFFLNSNQPHQILASDGKGVKVAYLQTSTSFCNEYVSCFRNLTVLENDLSAVLSTARLKELTELMVQAITDYMAESSDVYGLQCISTVSRLYSRLLTWVPYRKMSEADYLAQNKKMVRLSRITEYIDQNYSEKITLSDLAARENVTATYLSHFIRDNLHMTFQEYLGSVRFERALKLLRSTTMSLTDASIASGFSDVKYLSRMLENHFGSPARDSLERLRRELPEKEDAPRQLQTFAPDIRGLDWLKSFWIEYSD